MSILIKGMELSKNCYECQFAASYFRPTFASGRKPCSFVCVLTQKALLSTKRNRFCPLVELPPHGRLIDADTLYSTIFIGEQCLYSWDEIEDAIDDAPTIIEAEEGE